MSDWVAEFNEILSDYETEACKIAEHEIGKAAKDAAKDLRATDSLFKTHHKGYAKGWAVKNKGTFQNPEYIVHNKNHYRLTHLLENGHAMVVHGKRGGRARPIKHIEPVANKYIKELPDRIERALK